METYGAPCSLQAYNTSRLVISDIPRSVILNQTVEFTVDASQAGQGQLEVAINNGQVPKQVKALGNSKYHFAFVPKLNEPHNISITFNGHEVTGFPRQCQVITSDHIQVRGSSLKNVPINTQTWFAVDITNGDVSDLNITIFTPTNEQLSPSTLLTSDGLRVDWTPTEIGIYMVHVTLNGYSIPGSPFHVKCFDIKQVKVVPPTNHSIVGDQTKLLVDVSKAGEGNLEISVNYSGRNIPNQINPIENSHFEVQFIPRRAVVHYCSIRFNDEHVLGSPFAVNVMDKKRVTAVGKGLGSVPIDVPTSFTVFTPDTDNGELKCLITGLDDLTIPCLVTKVDVNRYEVTYTPDCVGEFYIEVFYNDIQIDNSPFMSRSFDVNQIKIHDFPSSSTIGSPTNFIIDATNSGAGNLEIAISRDGKNIPNYVQTEGSARFGIKFIPDQAVMHQVQIKFNGIDIPGSPFMCDVSSSSEFTLENYEYAPINKRTTFLIKANTMFDSNIYADIITPSGSVTRGQIEKTAANYHSIDYTPKEIGAHEIKFYDNEDETVLMKKYICQVYDSSKILVSDVSDVEIHQPCKFTINTTAAGHGTLSVVIKQNGNQLAHQQTQISPNIYEIVFVPETIYECVIQISFNKDTNVRTLVVPVKSRVEQIHVSPIPSGVVGRPVIFTIDVADINLASILVTESQSDRIVSHTMTSLLNDKKHYEISFIPNTARQHIVSISYDGKLVSKTLVDVCNVNKIHVSSMHDGVVGRPSVFSVDTHGAGEGHLEVTISNGQRTLPAQLKSIQARKFDIAFVPETSGTHSITIAFNGIPVDRSPFLINVHDASIIDKLFASDEDKNDNDEEDDIDEKDYEFQLGGPLEGTKVGEVAWLICETPLTRIYEDFDFHITDPDKNTIKYTRIQDSRERWRIEFEPTKAGNYELKTNNGKSEMTLAVMNILPAEYERYIYGERIVYPNMLNFVSIISDHDNIRVQIKSTDDTEIPVEMERQSLEWKFYYSLTNTGCYQLTVTDDNDHEQIFDIYCMTEEIDAIRNGGIEDITRLIMDRSKTIAEDVNVIVKDPLARTIPAAFYRNLNRDLVIEYIPVRTGTHEIFIRTQNNLLDICPIRIVAFDAEKSFDPVLRVQVKEILEHTFQGVTDYDHKLEISITDPFDRPIPFQRSTNERGELTISVSPVRVGTHWICISNDDSDSFAILPIFAFDDDYVPLSPVETCSLSYKPKSNKSNNSADSTSTTDSFSSFRELTTISETSEFHSSRPSSISPGHITSLIKEISAITSSIISNDSQKSSTTDDRSSPEVQVLDITDLNDPCVRSVSTFSIKDPDNKFNIQICDMDESEITYKTEHLADGRKCISYEPTVAGRIKIHILKGDEPINDTPLIVHAFDPSAVRLIDFPKKTSINKASCFQIDPSNAGKGALKIMIKDSNNQPVPISVEKQSNDLIKVHFKPVVLGLHSISILFNRIPIPGTPFQTLVEKVESTIDQTLLSELEQRGRSIYSKHELFLLAKQQESPHGSSSQIVRSLLSKSNDMLVRHKDVQPSKDDGNGQVIKPEDKNQEKSLSIALNETEIQRLQIIKDKFERGLPIDTIYDPRVYPFKVLLKGPYPLVTDDVHFLINHPHVAYIHIALNGIQIPLLASRHHNDTFLLKFRPTIAGNYIIILKNYMGQLILGSPYNFPVYNPNGARLEPFKKLQPINDCHFICNIDNVGQGKFFVMIYDQLKPVKIPCQIQCLSKNRIKVSFIPSKVGTYRIYIAYRNIPINGTPIDISAYDAKGVSLIAEHSDPVVVRTTVAYKVNTSLAGQGQLKAELIQPNTSINPCRCHIHELNNQEYLIQYIPNEPGRYQLRILFNDELIQGQSIDTDVYSLLPPPVIPVLSSFPIVDIKKILPHGTPRIGEDVCLQITTDKAPIQGQVSSNGTSVPCQLERAKDTHTWYLKFRPFVAGAHKIHVLHNGLSIMNSPYLIQVNHTNSKSILTGLTNTPCGIQIRTKSISKSQIRAVVLLETVQIPATISVISDDLIRINFIPQEPGLYYVNIFNGDQAIQGSPFPIHVTQRHVVKVSGQCFQRLRVNDLGIFRIHSHGQPGSVEARIFNLSVSNRHDVGQKVSFQLLETYEQLIQYPLEIFLTSLTILLAAQLRLTQERIRNLILEGKNGSAIISFHLFEIATQMPTNEQVIHALRNLIDKQAINLIDPNRQLLHAVHGSLAIGPKGEPVDVKLFLQSNGDYMGEFTPKQVGQYRIDVTFGNAPIQGSPFFTEVYDPSQVHVAPLPKDILAGIENTLEINVDNAGNVLLEVSIISSSGVNVPVKIDDVLTVKKVRFTPTEIGIHYLHVKFGSDVVPGTPIQMMVNNTRTVAAYGDGLHHALHENESSFMIDTQDIQGDLKVHIEGSNSVIKTNLERISKSICKVTYVPVEVGFINISITCNDKHILNSPFKANVTDPERVHVVGGWQSILDSQNRMRIITNEEKKVSFDTSHAGPGTLVASIKSMDNTLVPLRVDQQDSSAVLNFTIIKDGKYDLTLSYAGNSLPNMPIRIIATSMPLERSKIKVHGRGSYEARVNEEAEFTIDTSRILNHGNNVPIVRLVGSQASVEVRVHQTEKNKNMFRCSYKPTIPGNYLLNILWAHKEIYGSPFKVRVLSGTNDVNNNKNNNNNTNEASRVICSGDGLRAGVFGKEMKCLIDTRASARGELTAFCQGVNKTANCRLLDHRDGTFTLFIKPEESGRHILTIKYNGENVPGSPFSIKVNSALDASKVHVSGPGIEHGILSTFQSQFICETKGAGAGQLTVKVRGPKGGFRVEMQRDHLQERTIVCRYNPTEPGVYVISVKWSGQHINGSPFHVHIFECQEQLEKFRQKLNTIQSTDKKQIAEAQPTIK